MMKIRDYEIDIDIYDIISAYEWRKGRRKGDEFICCSPFRDEQHPSFSINLDTGLWIDFGSDDDFWKKGNLIKLLAYLENCSMEEIETTYLELYGLMVSDADSLELSINIQETGPAKTFSREELKPYLYRYRPYLLKRGITDEIMKKFVVGYDKETQAVAFFWMDADTGKVVAVKFRSIKSKQFYYLDGGQEVRNHLFGLYQLKQEGHKIAYIVESEIDALYLWSLGVPAVALGGSTLSENQRRLLLLSGIETLVIATDNDKAGYRIAREICRELGGHLTLKKLYIPPYAKDVNDLAPNELLNYVNHLEDIPLQMQ